MASSETRWLNAEPEQRTQYQLSVRNTFLHFDVFEQEKEIEQQCVKRSCSAPLQGSEVHLRRIAWQKDCRAYPTRLMRQVFKEDAKHACAYIRTADRHVQSFADDESLNKWDRNLDGYCDSLSCLVSLDMEWSIYKTARGVKQPSRHGLL